MEVVTPADFPIHSQRRRPRQAKPCDACRKAKTRCIKSPEGSGTTPCIHCSLRGTACTYRHGPPARSSTAAREDSPLLANEPQTSRSVNGDSSVPTLNWPRQERAVEPSQPSFPRNASAPSTASRTMHAPAALTASGPPQLGSIASGFSELHGLSSDMEPILMRHRPYDPNSHEYHLGTHGIKRVLHRYQAQDYPLTFHMVADTKAIDHEELESEVEAIEALVQPWGPKLLELFWRHVQPSYPIISKDGLMQAYEHRDAPCPLLGAIYLVATRWWQYDPDLSVCPMPDVTSLRKHVYRSIHCSYHSPKLSSIQAMLLVLQCQPEDPLNPDHTFAWGLTCQALAIGQCLGLHLDASDWSIPQAERNVRKRLAWALYMQDRWTAVAYGRPVHIHDDDWAVTDLTDGDFADCDLSEAREPEEERWSMTMTGKHHFLLMVRLSQILSDVLAQFYTVKKSSEQDTAVLFQGAGPIFEALDLWSASVPESLGMHIKYQRRLCFHGYLHFSYYGVAMTLLRRLIRSTALGPPCADHAILANVRQQALETAQGAIRFVSELRPDHLEAFWYYTTPYLFSLLGSFITLLLVTSLSSQERDFWQETLDSYIWKLRTMNKSSEPMQYAANRLEGAILRGLEHALAVNIVEPVDDTVSPQMANYNREVMKYLNVRHWDLFMAGGGSYDLSEAPGGVHQQVSYGQGPPMM
ncbi:fungal-specific transcription factor domain-containing protein [Microdochium trichocladiopsis]|uniref:Fungal-specific transcription factor domain-containing protein n=1 Tax=Microdochium trichocladiopsis TaxID=1682393 RepID=A0A9P8XXB8_9PEZI|nr:fungal-specific transcription factor domain-containing protein [Microdochium trichocladiopsis]KAH7021636.1 fungal-specific transcription factor domain-containing protein [Microdochium trichocladiopsis]